MIVLGVAAAIVVPVTQTASAATCALVPTLRDVAVTQGVGSYPVLVRGKESIARFYLSLPSCAASTASITVTGATVTVSANGATSAPISAYSPAPGSTPPAVATYATAPALDSPADPKFVIPGLLSASTGRFTATFSASISYASRTTKSATPVNGTVVLATRPGTTSPITMTVEQKTNSLRVLVVPMGNARQTYASQFDSVANATTQNAMSALARKFPVPDGTSDLGGTGGLRYSILPTLLDLSSLLDSTGKFCGTSANFDAIKAQLAQFLQSWNTANPTKPADRALGVVKDTLSNGGSAGCAEGMAAINGPEAWVRAVAATSTVPSDMGSLAAMELSHTMGLVPTRRADPYSPYHSPNTQADGTAPNRAYNVMTRSYLADDHTAMDLSGTWNDTDTLFERDDWATLLCDLGGPPTTDCTTPGTVGTSVGVGANPTFVLSGTTDDTPAGTHVVESYFARGVPRTVPDPSSDYHLVQLQGSTVLSDDGVPVVFNTSAHSDDGATPPPSTQGLFSVAFPFETGATRIEFRKGATVLYSRNRGADPQLTGTTVTGPSGGSGPPVLTQLSTDAGGTPVAGVNMITANSASADGKIVAFQSSATNLVPGDTNGAPDVFVKHTDTGVVQRVSVHDDGTQITQGTNPAISADGRYVSFSSNDPTLDNTFGFAFPQVYVRDLQTAHTFSLFDWAPGTTSFGGGGAGEQSLSGDATAVSFSTNSNLAKDDTNGPDVFVTVRPTGTSTSGTAELITVRPDGSPAQTAPGGADIPTTTSISADGNLVAFASTYSDLLAGNADTNSATDVFVRDRGLGQTELVSAAVGGGPANGDSLLPQMTPDGRYVAYSSSATNLTSAPDSNGVNDDVYVTDLATHATIRVSVDEAGAQLAGTSFYPSISPNGRYVSFADTSTGDLYRWDRTTGKSTKIASPGVNMFATSQALDSGDVIFSQSDATTGTVYLATVGGCGVACPPPGTADVVTTATADNPTDLRLDLIYACDGVNYPVAVGVAPDAVEGDEGSWSLNADTSLGCEDGTLSAVVNDGFTQADPIDVAPGSDSSDATPKPPVAAVATPTPGQRLLQFDTLALDGTGDDAESGSLAGSALQWHVTGPGTDLTASGNVVDLDPPAAGWTPGTYEVDLTVTDGDGMTDQTSTSFTVVADADHDNMPATAEQQSCFPAGADHDASNAYTDYDGDGVPNADDLTLTGKPCVASTGYDGAANFTTNPAVIKSTLIGSLLYAAYGSRVAAAQLYIPFVNFKSVNQTTVRITKIAGKPVSLSRLGWTANADHTATAYFDLNPVRAYLTANGLLHRSVDVEVSGTASTGRWSFSAVGSVSTP